MRLTIIVGALFCAVTLRAGIVFQSGVFVQASPYLTSPSAVSTYEANASAIEAGTFVSQTVGTADQMSIWADPTYENGAAPWTVTTATGLALGDIVEVSETWSGRMSPTDSWSPYGSMDRFYEIGPYTRNSDQYLQAQQIYSFQETDGSYTFVKGTAQYYLFDPANYVPTSADFDSLWGMGVEITRNMTVYSGATLDNEATDFRGMYSDTGITGGTEIASYSVTSEFDATAPEPGTLALVGLGAVALLIRRRRRAL